MPILDHYELRLNGGPWIDIGLTTSDASETNVAYAPGSNTLQVAGVDTDGRRGLIATVNFTRA